MMGVKQAKLMVVPSNGQISIGKTWAGKQIKVEEVGEGEIRISSGTFVPDSQATFFTKEATQTLNEFNEWENKTSPKTTNTKDLFTTLRKKK